MYQGSTPLHMPPPDSVWYRDVSARIDTITAGMDKRQIKRYKLDLLPRLAARIDNFATFCPECQPYRQEISELLEVAANPTAIPKAEFKEYTDKVNAITKHLQKTHKLVTQGYYMSLASSIGPGLGFGIGAFTDNTGAGIGIGVALGTGIGWLLDRKAKREGRVI